MHEWNSEKEVGEALSSLINLTGRKIVLEIGTFEGVTSNTILTNSPSIESLTMIDIEDLRSDKFKKDCQTKFKNQAHFILCESMKVNQKDLRARPDLIFFDGVHEFDHQVKEFQRYEKMAANDCIFTFHDTQHIAELRQFVHWLSKFYQLVNLPTPDRRGLTIAYGYKIR
jgi:predicted O-methyltransferase YrrM